MTRFDSDNLGLSATGLPLVRDLIHDRTGLFYEDGRCDTLSSRLAPLVIDLGFQSFLDLYYLLKYDDVNSAATWPRVLDALSVQETYFWREIDQIQALSSYVLPILAERRTTPIRIWSVPCATGEEPLTIAMVLNEAGWFARAPIEIHASDGSPAGIAKAQTATYRGRAFRALSPALREKYFVPVEDGICAISRRWLRLPRAM
jgi:chemotaxis protein methyltransferase CheR